MRQARVFTSMLLMPIVLPPAPTDEPLMPMAIVGRSRSIHVNDTPGNAIDSDSSPNRAPYPKRKFDDGSSEKSPPLFLIVGTYSALTSASTPRTFVRASGNPLNKPIAASAV